MAQVRQFELDIRTPGKGVHIEVDDVENESVVLHPDKVRWENKGYEPVSLVVLRTERDTQYVWVMRKRNAF